MKRLFMPVLAALALLIGLTATSSTAYASDYSGNCAGVSSWDGSGNATITDSNCTISTDVTAAGFISITASGTVTTQALQSTAGDLTISAGGDISTGAITAGFHFGATSSGGSITISGAVAAGNDGGVGNVLIQSSGNFQASSTVSTPGGGIEIDANTSGGNTLFTIGSSTSNGVATSISASNGLFLVNGNSSSTGGITIADGSDINANPQNANSGLIFINAQNGTLTLSSGTLSTDGASGDQANSIILLAKTVSTGGSTVMTASQDSGAASNGAKVGIAAQTVTVGGTQLHADAGASGSGASVSINPQGWLTMTSNEDLESLGWTVTVTGTQNAALTINGSGALTMTSNGANSQVQVGGYPVTFSNGGAVTAQSKWDSSTMVSIGNPSPYSGSTGVAFNNSGDVTLDASATVSNAAAGQVWLFMDQFSTTSATSFVVHANGNGSGAGGTVDFFPSTASFSSTTATVTVSADSPTGNGGT
ncbi:MAG TPA: hypothetical protein V6C69_21695, partial [Trichormus sp.]